MFNCFPSLCCVCARGAYSKFPMVYVHICECFSIDKVLVFKSNCLCVHAHTRLTEHQCLSVSTCLNAFPVFYSHKHVQYGIWDSDKCPYNVNKNICVLHNSKRFLKDSIQCPFILKSLLYLNTSWSDSVCYTVYVQFRSVC